MEMAMEYHQKKRLKILMIVVGLFCSLTACESQSTTSKPTQVTTTAMEKFDLKTYQEKNIDGQYEFTTDDGTYYQQWENAPHSYSQRCAKANSVFETYKEYDHKTLVLIKSGEEFYGFPVGVWKTFTENGTLMNESDEDKPYAFSIYDLAKKMKGYQIDIMSRVSQASVSRSTNPEPQYVVSWPENPESPYERKVVVVDAVKGETIVEKQTSTTHPDK